MSTAWYRPGFVPKLIRQWKTTTTTTTTKSKPKTTFQSNNSNVVENFNIRSIEIWEGTCIVTTNFSVTAQTSILMNPANPSLSGVSKFPYFPKGGPEPKLVPTKDSHPIMGYVTQWGGMEVGNGMMFAANVVDGLVHQLGGKLLAQECQKALIQKHRQQQQQQPSTSLTVSFPRVPEGTAIITSPGSPELRQQYEWIVHTVPPFYKKNDNDNNKNDDDDKYNNTANDDTINNTVTTSTTSTTTQENPSQYDVLEACYLNSIEEILKLYHGCTTTSNSTTTKNNSGSITNNNNNNIHNIRIACPLLGAGCRGFPSKDAIEVASKACIKFLLQGQTQEQEPDDTTTLHPTMTRAIISSSPSIVQQRQQQKGENNIQENNSTDAPTTTTSSTTGTITLAFCIPNGELRQALMEEIDRQLSLCLS